MKTKTAYDLLATTIFAVVSVVFLYSTKGTWGNLTSTSTIADNSMIILILFCEYYSISGFLVFSTRCLKKVFPTLKNISEEGMIWGLIVGLFLGFLYGSIDGLVINLFCGLGLGLFWGLTAGIIVGWIIEQNEKP